MRFTGNFICGDFVCKFARDLHASLQITAGKILHRHRLKFRANTGIFLFFSEKIGFFLIFWKKKVSSTVFMNSVSRLFKVSCST